VTITFADLKDPAKAEQFVRESIAGIDQEIARLEEEAYREAEALRKARPHDEEAERRACYVIKRMHFQTDMMRERRQFLSDAITRLDAARAAARAMVIITSSE